MATDPLPRSDVPAEPTEAEYRAFCDTVMATGRGRWFLAEHARRHRKTTADDALEALARLEHRLHGGRNFAAAHVFEELRSLAATIRHARLDIGWSDSEFSRGAKVMALLELLEDRIGGLLDDRAPEGAAPAAEERAETARVQLTVIAANPVPLRARTELPPIDILADATVVTLPAPAVAPAERESQTVRRDVAVAAEPPASTLTFAAVELFEPFEAEQPGAERTTVLAPVDFAADPFDANDIAPQTFEAPVAVAEPAFAEAPLAETPVAQATQAEALPAAVVPQRPPGYDPMTPVRALSDDERIALVS